MSIVKSISVGEGDMFYIKHNGDNFTVIDCCMSDEDKDNITEEINENRKGKEIARFISTHPDEDHQHGLEYLFEKVNIPNFYCVENKACKSDPSPDFKFYCKLRDDEAHHFFVSEDCKRKWMNESDEQRASAGIHFRWPVLNNTDFKDALTEAEAGEAFNNISPIFTYRLQNGAQIMWMGDMEHDFQEKIKDEVEWPEIDILFAPHHGRESGKVPDDILKKLSPEVIVIGEAPSKDLDYYCGYNTITQNSAGDITFKCESGIVHVYVSKDGYNGDKSFLIDQGAEDPTLGHYIGSFKTGSKKDAI